MKKNLRIVSVAAAALLAVAPVAASAVSTVSAADATTTTTATTTNKPTIDLTGAGAVTNAADTVTVTPNFTLTAAVAKDKKVTASATLQGTITASLNGTSVTANVIDAAKDVTLKSNTGYTTIYKYDATTKTTENNLCCPNLIARLFFKQTQNLLKGLICLRVDLKLLQNRIHLLSRIISFRFNFSFRHVTLNLKFVPK